MHRLMSNRWWTFIATLALCIACSAHPRLVRADSSDPNLFGDPTGGTEGSGDPDVPDSPSKQKGFPRGEMRPITHVYAMKRPAGDGFARDSVLMWRLRVVRMSLQAFLVRF